jgi:hypothetical protein
VLGERINWYLTDQISVEAVLVPVTGTSLFPTDTAASLKAQGIQTTVSALDGDLLNAVGGERISYRSTAFDASISYLHDLDANYTPVVASDLSVNLVRKRIDRLGADFKTTLDRFGLWAEGCYSLTGNSDSSDYSERLSQWQHTVGIDFNYGPQDAGYADLQYEATWIPGYDASPNTFASTDPRYLEKNLLYSVAGYEAEWLHTVIVNTHYNLASDTLVPSLSASYSIPVHYDDSTFTRYGSLLLKPEIDLSPLDSFHLTMGATLAWSWKKASGGSVSIDTGDSVGVYTPQNNVFIAMKYQWNATK